MKLETNLKFLVEQQEQKRQKDNKLSSLAKCRDQMQRANTLPNTSKILPPGAANAAAIASNHQHLTMEDEEGEIFDNTYLTELKTGRYPREVG